MIIHIILYVASVVHVYVVILKIFDQSFHIHTDTERVKVRIGRRPKNLWTRRKEGRERRREGEKKKERKKLPWRNLQVIRGCSLR